MKRALLLLVLTQLSFFTWPAHAASATGRHPTTNEQTTSRPIVLVRVLSLYGTGPDLLEHRLFDYPDGFVTTLDALGRVGYQVGGEKLTEGGYHTLFVQLADEYERVRPDGTLTRGRFSDEDKPTRLRIRGMIMVRKGEATPLRMLNDSPYYGSSKKALRHRSYRDDDDNDD